MKVKIVNKSNYSLPAYATPNSSGVDLRANITETIVLNPLERKLFPTGIYIELPVGYEAQVRPRSGLALKQGITVLNSPGSIDQDFRGEIGVILINQSPCIVNINPGDRIAQLVFAKYETAEFEEVEELNETKRGENGFGHSGIN